MLISRFDCCVFHCCKLAVYALGQFIMWFCIFWRRIRIRSSHLLRCVYTCKPCMMVNYCNAECQRKHWSRHKKQCKLQVVAKLRWGAVHRPACLSHLLSTNVWWNPLSCASLPTTTILSVPINDFAIANEELAENAMEQYYDCCWKSTYLSSYHCSTLADTASNDQTQ